VLASCAWASDRAVDLADVFVLEASAGLGVAVDVKATDLVHVGAGYAHVRKAGLRGRQPVWMWDREVGLPASAIVWLGAVRDGELWRLLDLHVDGAELWHGASSPWRLADLEVGLFAGVVGLRFGFSPGELVDLAWLADRLPADRQVLAACLIKGCYFPAADPSAQELLWRLVDLLPGLRRDMAQELVAVCLDDQVHPGVVWTKDRELGWVNNDDHSARQKPQGLLSTLLPTDYASISRFFL
jgi:hypothetical protein